MDKLKLLRKETTLCLSLLLIHHLFIYSSAIASSLTNTIPFNNRFTPLFGEANIKQSVDETGVSLHLNEFSGSGFKSSNLYNHGFFSAKIQLPSDYTAGVVVAFYTTNGDMFEKTHDELDFEFLGNINGKPWRFQTNMYGNGSTSRGREERYTLWFDPSKEYHRYSILWTTYRIIFYIDDIPIREIVRNDAMGGDYPSKPMALYATIWDASEWATSGGKYKANYKYSPFIAEFKELTLHGCAMDPVQEVVTENCIDSDMKLENASFGRITQKQRWAMKRFRQKYMYYSYCHDMLRYPSPPSECDIDPIERQRFRNTGRLKFESRHGHNRHSKRSSQVRATRMYENQITV